MSRPLKRAIFCKRKTPFGPSGRPASGHDDFFLEAASGEDQEQCAHGKEGETIEPEMRKAGAAENDAPGDVDVIAGRNQIADEVKNGGHGFARKDVAGEENAGEKGKEGELDRLGLGIGLTGNENADGERDE